MSFLKRLFGGGGTTTPATMSEQKAEEVIQTYGAALETKAETPGRVADISELPFPKGKIKEALIIGLKTTNDQEVKEMLKVGYIQLADWQEGVGKTDQGLDLLKMDPNEDQVKLLQQILAEESRHQKWQPVVLAEQKELKQELVDLGLW